MNSLINVVAYAQIALKRLFFRLGQLMCMCSPTIVPKGAIKNSST